MESIGVTRLAVDFQRAIDKLSPTERYILYARLLLAYAKKRVKNMRKHLIGEMAIYPERKQYIVRLARTRVIFWFSIDTREVSQAHWIK